MDSKTDAIVQSTISDSFQESTMLIIAHRLETLDHCNRVIRLEHGPPTRVIEMEDTVEALRTLKDHEGLDASIEQL